MRRNVLMAVVGLGLVSVAFAGYRYHTAYQFAASYEAYAQLANAHADAAAAPAVEANPLRRELNLTLARCLSDESLKVAERLELAQHGLVLLGEQEKQIDAIDQRGGPIPGAI